MYDESVLAKKKRARLHNAIGMAWMQEAEPDYAEAKSCFRRAIKISDGVYEAYSNLGEAINAQGRFSDAYDWLKFSLESCPPSIVILTVAMFSRAGALGFAHIPKAELAISYLRSGKSGLSRGKKLVKELLESAPFYHRTHFVNALLASSEARWTDCIS